ncbi:MAG: ABC transporter ATP-binding protein [Deltaproteobacteria bacterium]|jgi:NitT/TauT family transport system ATP-binding protein|nr:ABC transporter ATP-binding protein [Deltaproteobacteria bacterium]
MLIELTSVSKTFSDGRKQSWQSLSDITIGVEKGEFVCFLGPSGCGKTTLVNLMAGFESPTSGSVHIGGEPVSRPSIRHVTIFQDYGLLPWRTVKKNVELGLETQKIGRRERARKAEDLIRKVGLDGFAKYRPWQLSGGMRQRVAIARALAVEPEIIFMDEPLGSLDALTRMAMQDEILALKREKGATIVFVTHDVDEAVFMADRIVVMTPGPGRIKKVFSVDLPHQRERSSSEFASLRRAVIEEMMAC